jgi:CheY-like chemotaxis protein
LRNPLAPISHATQALRLAESDRKSVHAATEMLERQVGQMVRLVDDLLDISRINRGKIELRKDRIELAPIISQAVEATRALYKSMNHELTVTLPPHSIYLDADPARLAQVVGNLLNNACKFTDAGGHVWLTVEQDLGQAVIRVRDNGIGIAADLLPRLFEMFVQADTSQERSREGLGIGLTLVKTLVEMQGGTVEGHSEGPGLGSEFVIRMPTVAEMPRPLPPETVPEPLPAVRRRILVVDDNDDAAEWLATVLRLNGHETYVAHDGLEAIRSAEQIRPDAVLLDIGLPRLDGYEVCRRIRAQAWGQDLLLIALTGWGQEEDRQKSRDAGFDTHLVKPVDDEVLLKVLASLPSGTSAG